MGAARLVAIALLGSCSPFGGGAFHCAEDTTCGAGVCEADGFCAFVDGTCPSGFRYGDASGGRSNACTGEQLDSGHPGDGDPNVMCYGAGLVSVCPVVPLTVPLAIAGPRTIDTSPASSDCLALAAPGATNVCAIGGLGVEITGAITAIGPRPLVIVSAGTLHVAANLDVASHRLPQETIGAGANEVCPGAIAAASGGGGAGGSFGTLGGTGGANGAGAGGVPGAVQAGFAGGCVGQPGSIVATGNAGAGGHGGGAVYLIARTTLTIDATIDASGEGGASAISGSMGGGAGGGGAGGFVGLDAAVLAITANARIFANGGGGGEGDGSGGTQGAFGGDPIAYDQATVVGNLSGTGGEGGAGAYLTTAAAAGTNGNGGGGGGGGGGGIGIIKVTAPQQQVDGKLSPNPS